MPSERILLADDSEDDVMLLREAFHEAGSRPSFSHVMDGQAALEVCIPPQESDFHLIVLDYFLPKHNGGEIVERLLGWGIIPRVPVVLLSNQISASESQRLIDLGVAMVAEKPVDFDRLCILARQMLTLARTKLPN